MSRDSILSCISLQVFQRRKDGHEDFYRTWNDYKTGFGQLDSEFWFGEDHTFNLSVTWLAFMHSCVRFWHAPLRVRSAKRRHHSPEWMVLSHANNYCFVQGQVQWFHVLLGSLHLRSTGGVPVVSSSSTRGKLLRSAWHLIVWLSFTHSVAEQGEILCLNNSWKNVVAQFSGSHHHSTVHTYDCGWVRVRHS